MKKLNLFIIKSFIGPFIFTFLIAIFLLLMQFLWKYIDDLVGKGLDFLTISKLLFYAAARFVPMALPISVLLSSIMTFGNIAEKNELMAIKSAGISLKKCMRPLLMFIIIISASSFLFSNYFMPYANLKAGSLLYDIRKQKPALNIKEGMFYNELSGYSIKIDKKLENGIDLEGVMIYDHTSEEGNDKVIIAEKGQMYLSENENYFIISLENGYSYYEMNINKKDEKRPLQRSQFKQDILRFDMSDFGMKRTSEELYRNHYAMMNNAQLTVAIDSIYSKSYAKLHLFKSNISDKIDVDFQQLESNFSRKDNNMTYYPSKVYANAISSVKYLKSMLSNTISDQSYSHKIAIKHKVEWHRKWSLAVACIIFFLIGAPLGAIIRKGGFGMPVIVSVGFFITYHIVSVTAEKMVKESEISVTEGMWIANFILLPVGLFLSYKANTDSQSFSLPSIKQLFVRKN
ncbi:MAG: LptF/LptG family permease [Flavobacteriales bacterium]|nr:LptF/LptG family permease [Flavobacteriales bacterium]